MNTNPTFNSVGSHMVRFTAMPLIAFMLLMGLSMLQAQEDVEITGTYQMHVACYETYHEEVLYVVEPGKDKFSGIQHALSIPPALKKDFQLGDKITIKGKKAAAVKRMMTKGEVRKAMYQYLKNGIGVPCSSRDMAGILAKIKVDAEPQPVDGNAKQAASAPHDHGALQLKAADDDGEVVEVSVMEHIEVTSIKSAK